MAEHSGLPVAGYTAQSDDKVALVNENKQLEERVLRQVDKMFTANWQAHDGRPLYDPRMMEQARTKIQEAFMWLNRAVFQPQRISLPEDTNQGEDA